MSEEKVKQEMTERTVRIVKIDSEFASGWGIVNDVITIEISKSDWETFEKAAGKTRADFDFALAEAVLRLFIKD